MAYEAHEREVQSAHRVAVPGAEPRAARWSMIFDWHRIDLDPTSPRVKSALKAHLLTLDRGLVPNRDAVVDEFVRGRRVLDVGIVAHVVRHADGPDWLHRRIRRQASDCLGVDIVEDGIEQLRSQGYRVRCVDATSDVDLGERFDRVVLGEIIEHVDDPVALLRFSRRHLNTGGEIFASTPNGLYIANVLESLKQNVTTPNAEHVGAISPAGALEIGRRAGLELFRIERIAVNPSQLSVLGALAVRLLALRRSDLDVLTHTYCFYYR
jgi:2-polyprenyl-3-methyl-5-hydroxy-6-metoxy-1,4-benzoquinol methylase